MPYRSYGSGFFSKESIVSHVSLQLDNDVTNYEPGAQLIATAAWELDKPATSIELRLMWYTRGKGGTDSDVVQEVSFDNPEASGQKRLGIQLPDSPYSFSGRLISLMWALELRALPSGETDRVEIVLAPGGQEILLGNAPPSSRNNNDVEDNDESNDDEFEDEEDQQ